MDIVFKGRHTGVPERFRSQASAKLTKLGRLDQKLIRIDVEVTKERNPRQAGRMERVELTIRHRGPAIRAEAAADDRYTALDLALAKLESRLRRVNDRRTARGADTAPRLNGIAAATPLPSALGAHDQVLSTDVPPLPAISRPAAARPRAARPAGSWPGTARAPGQAGQAAYPAGEASGSVEDAGRFVPIDMDGDGPLVVREKFHQAGPMSIDQALFEMELVGHDFFLFRDSGCGQPSVVYRRRGYDYGVIRLVEE